jgi:hypothetical protein
MTAEDAGDGRRLSIEDEAPEDGAQRLAALAGRERAGGHPAEQVEVAPVHQRELHRRGGQVRGGLEAAKPAADHDHPMRARRRAGQ